jgi:EmrB/QacA subfamily drug resistance transporter
VDEVSAATVMPGRRGKPGLTLAVLGLAAMAFSVLQSLVIPVLPDIGRNLHVSEQAVTWVLTGYLLSASVATPILGRLGDMFGKRRILVITMTALAAGTVIAGVATTLAVLIVGRIVQGVGGALFPLAFAIIRDELPAERVAGAIGFISATLGIGGGLGIILAGPIDARLGYHWLFWAPLPLIILAALGIHFLIPESPVRSGGRVNLRSAVLLSAWLITLLIGITEGPQWGWLSPAFGATVLVAAVLFGGWWIAEWRSASPLVDVRMLAHPAVWRTNVVALAVGFGLYGSLTLIPEILQAPHSAGYGFGVTVTDAGLFLLPQTLVVFVFGAIAGRISAAIGSARAVLIGVLLAAGSFTLLAVAYTRVWQILAATILLGAAVGLTYSGMPNVIVESVPADQTGVATGMNANVRTLGSALGGQVTTSIVTTTIVTTSVVSTGTGALSSSAAGYPAASGFTISFILLAVVSLGAAIVAAGVPRNRPAG